MGSIGTNSNEVQEMSFEDAEYAWTMDIPDKNTNKYKAMVKALDKVVMDPSTDYKGTVYRGIDIDGMGITTEQELLNKFKVGNTIPSSDNPFDFVSWSNNFNSAADFSYDGSSIRVGDQKIAVMFVNTQGLKHSAFLPETEGSMNEVLAKKSPLTITRVSSRYADDWGMKVYMIFVKEK